MGVTCYLVVHPTGLLLYDTGLSDRLVGRPRYENISKAMARSSSTRCGDNWPTLASRLPGSITSCCPTITGTMSALRPISPARRGWSTRATAIRCSARRRALIPGLTAPRTMQAAPRGRQSEWAPPRGTPRQPPRDQCRSGQCRRRPDGMHISGAVSGPSCLARPLTDRASVHVRTAINASR